MITLHKLLNILSFDCELEIFGDESLLLFASGKRDTIDVPVNLYDRPVRYCVPGIVTKIFIEDH